MPGMTGDLTPVSLAASPADEVDLVVFDADDTLWKSEDYFRELAANFVDVIEPYAAPGVDVAAVLHTIEVGNVALTGYGVAAYTLSMVQAAIEATGGRIPANLLTGVIRSGYDVLARPVEVLDGVVDSLEQIAASHPIAVITKGDLLHQRRKLEHSGLADRFAHSRVVRDKDVATYRSIFSEWDIDPRRVLMIGNSMRSDVLPILELGGRAVYIPYHVTWAHEVVEGNGHTDVHLDRFVELETIAELDRWFRSPSCAS